MMNRNIILAMSAVVLTISAISCKEDSYKPGPETADGTISAYFTSDNEANLLITPEEYAECKTITLNVHRKLADESVSIPVIVTYKDDKFDIPSAVNFDAGDADTTLVITMNALEEKKEYAYSIRLDDKFVDHYTMNDGSDVFTGSVMIAKWIKVVEDAAFYYSDRVFETTYSDIFWLDGQNKFYIENFLGSEINLGFRIKHYDKNGKEAFSASDTTTWNGIFEPTDHFYNDPDGYPYWWFMSDVTNEVYASWTPEGATVGINYINFYRDDENSYAMIYLAGKKEDDEDWTYGGWLTPYIYFSDGAEGYKSLLFYWEGITDLE